MAGGIVVFGIVGGIVEVVPIPLGTREVPVPGALVVCGCGIVSVTAGLLATEILFCLARTKPITAITNNV